MPHTFEELKKKTVAELKVIAKDIDHEAVKGYTQLNKDHLIVAICAALNIDHHVHHEVKGIDKASIKAKIRELKKNRDAAISAHDPMKLKDARKHIKSLKKKLRRAMV